MKEILRYWGIRWNKVLVIEGDDKMIKNNSELWQIIFWTKLNITNIFNFKKINMNGVKFVDSLKN